MKVIIHIQCCIFSFCWLDNDLHLEEVDIDVEPEVFIQIFTCCLMCTTSAHQQFARLVTLNRRDAWLFLFIQYFYYHYRKLPQRQKCRKTKYF